MNRARRPLLLFALIAAAPVLVAAPWAFAAIADTPPTISFTATGTVPLTCGSHPNVSSLQVKTGTGIVFANNTGAPATLTIGGVNVSDLDPGTGALVRLRKGQHDVRLVPQCAVVTGTDAVVVNVVPGGEINGSASSDGPSVVLVGPTGSVPSVATPSVATGTAARGTTSGGTASGGTAAGGPASGGTASRGTAEGTAPTATPVPALNPQADQGDGPMESVVIDVKPIPLGDPSDPKDGRLLAVIAAICVIGVTAAIIRAIVSQRTSSAVRA